jgi:hypothetical protein
MTKLRRIRKGQWVSILKLKPECPGIYFVVIGKGLAFQAYWDGTSWYLHWSVSGNIPTKWFVENDSN